MESCTITNCKLAICTLYIIESKYCNNRHSFTLGEMSSARKYRWARYLSIRWNDDQPKENHLFFLEGKSKHQLYLVMKRRDWQFFKMSVTYFDLRYELLLLSQASIFCKDIFHLKLTCLCYYLICVCVSVCKLFILLQQNTCSFWGWLWY